MFLLSAVAFGLSNKVMGTCAPAQGHFSGFEFCLLCSRGGPRGVHLLLASARDIVIGSENMERRGWRGPFWNSYNYWDHQQLSPLDVPSTLTSEAPQPLKMYPLMVPISQARKLKLREAE